MKIVGSQLDSHKIEVESTDVSRELMPWDDQVNEVKDLDKHPLQEGGLETRRLACLRLHDEMLDLGLLKWKPKYQRKTLHKVGGFKET